jgi:hypothetical protein
MTGKLVISCDHLVTCRWRNIAENGDMHHFSTLSYIYFTTNAIQTVDFQVTMADVALIKCLDYILVLWSYYCKSDDNQMIISIESRSLACYIAWEYDRTF